jgi:Skp family chaperone for outer membrane proteins
MGQPPSETQMKQGLEKLKSSNPELAQKMEKVQSRMTELQKSGKSQEEIFKTLESEFGKPTEADMKQIGQSMMGSLNNNSFDLTSILSNRSRDLNDSILSFLDSRNQKDS